MKVFNNVMKKINVFRKQLLFLLFRMRGPEKEFICNAENRHFQKIKNNELCIK